MSLSTIKTAIAAKIAAATTATLNSDLAILKVIGKKLGLNTNNITTISNTKSDSATVDTSLTDLVLMSQACTDYCASSYISELRAFNSGITDITMDDGSRWLRTGFYESDHTKWDNRYWPYALVGGGASGWSYKSTGGQITTNRGIAVLNSGKKIAIPTSTSASVMAHTTHTSAGVQVGTITGQFHDYSYDDITDTLWLLQISGILYKITNDASTIVTIAPSTYIGSANTTARSVFAQNGKVFIGFYAGVRRSPDNGNTWGSYISTNIPTNAYVKNICYNEETDVLFIVCNGSDGWGYTSGTPHTFWYSIGNAAWVSSISGSNVNLFKGMCTDICNSGKNILMCFVFAEWDGTTYYYNGCLHAFNCVTLTRFDALIDSSNYTYYRYYRLYKIPKTNQVIYLYYSWSSNIYQILLYDFSLSTSALAGTTFSSLNLFGSTTTDSKYAISLYVDTNKIYLFSQTINYLEKTALVGSPSVNTFTHIRIS